MMVICTRSFCSSVLKEDGQCIKNYSGRIIQPGGVFPLSGIILSSKKRKEKIQCRIKVRCIGS